MPNMGRKYMRLAIATSVAFIFFGLRVEIFNSEGTPPTQKVTHIKTTTVSKALPPWASLEILEELNQSYSMSTKTDGNISCRLPKLQPFENSILHLAQQEPEPLVCETHKYPVLFNSTLYPNPRLVPVKSLSVVRKLGVKSCCFRELRRLSPRFVSGEVIVDNSMSSSKKCLHLSLVNATEVPFGWDFVGIACKFEKTFYWSLSGHPTTYQRLMDFHAFFHVKRKNSSESQKEHQKRSKAVPEQRPLNVMILAFDGMSRMSFLRTLPEVHTFLKRTLSAVELEAFHKIAVNTFPNIASLLTGKKTLEVRYNHQKMENPNNIGGHVFPNIAPLSAVKQQSEVLGNDTGLVASLDCEQDEVFDNCPFIWKEYSAAGYKTLFAEDGVKMSIFNMNHNGFREAPTDHYFRTFQVAADTYTAHETWFNSRMCYGPRPAFSVMLEYMERMALVMESTNTPFFQFGMTGSITHEIFNGGMLMHHQLLEFLQHLHSKDIFNTTVLILLADHGLRFGPIENYFQGFLEERLPPLYIAVPPWFRTRYPTAFSNLQNNRKRLVTVYDVHATLRDIVDIENFEEDTRVPESASAISLFQPILLSRTCETAGISQEFCLCNMKENCSNIHLKTHFKILGITRNR